MRIKKRNRPDYRLVNSLENVAPKLSQQTKAFLRKNSAPVKPPFLKEKYSDYQNILQQIGDLEAIQALMGWDKEVYMPPAGNATRSRQLALLAGISHEKATSAHLGELLEELHQNKEQLTASEARNVFLSRKEYLKQAKFTKAFVERRSLCTSKCYDAWVKGRAANDATDYLVVLQEMIDLKKEEAEIYGYQDHPYNALLDLYEPEMTVAQLDPLFSEVKEKLVAFVGQLRQKQAPDNSFLQQFYPKDAQWQFGLAILKGIGYDFNAGRQDISPHPFTTTFGPGDVRVTTRIDEENFDNMCWSCIHEGGHALYEQGLPSESFGLPLGKYCSLGIHESQSRLWENNVGRALPFWKYWYPKLQESFPKQLNDTTLQGFYKGINQVKPDFVRTESDELHYHFHILIRYEIEKELIGGSVKTMDLKALWAQKYEEYLGLKVPNDNLGILQDIHWAYGSFGYFPTYSLGSMYAAQFYHQAEKEIDQLEEQLKNGNTDQLLQWLREKVHIHGQNYTAGDLCKKVTGEKLNFSYFMDYVEKKYKEIYS